MGLFSKERVVKVCPNCKKAYYTAETGSQTCSCGSSIYFLTSNIISESEWQQMTEEEQNEYKERVVVAVTDSRNKSKNNLVGYEKFITTTSKFENHEIEEYICTVTGTDIYLIGGLIGGGLSNQETLWGDAFNEAKKKMYQKALACGANAVVGMSVQGVASGTTGNIIVVATGTAVKLKNVNE